MEENDNDDDQNKKTSELNENAKRLKTENGDVAIEAGTSSGESKEHDDSQSAGTSFPRAGNSKKRNYRKPTNDSDDSDDGTVNAAVEKQEPVIPPTSESTNSCNPPSSPDTIDESDHEMETERDSDPPVLSKEKPKHKWFMVPSIINRQYGASAKLKSNELFQQRCYGSLHCVQRLELMYKLEHHQGCVNSLNFHPDGSLLASGSDDLNVVIWNWPTGEDLLSFDTKHRGNVFQSKFMPLSGDLHIVTCARDGYVRLHQVSRYEGLRSSRKLGQHRGPTHKLALLKDQPHVVLSAGEDGCVFSHDVRTNKPVK